MPTAATALSNVLPSPGLLRIQLSWRAGCVLGASRFPLTWHMPPSNEVNVFQGLEPESKGQETQAETHALLETV